MRFYFFIFIILILVSMSFVHAVGFSPASLTYSLDVGEEQCQTVRLTSDSETITVEDKWKENTEIEWDIKLFTASVEDLGLLINYDSELTVDEREVEVCLSGSRIGEYQGVLLLTEEAVGNSIIQMGVWLRVNIGQQQKSNLPPSSGGGSSGGGGGGGSVIQQNNTGEVEGAVVEEGEPIVEIQEQGDDDNKDVDQADTAPITGGVIGSVGRSIAIVIAVLVVIAVLAIYVYKHNKGKSKGGN
jgi:hypothetical protein